MINTCDSNNVENKIIEVARAVFIEKGYAETSMSEIASKAGINRPALHYYFRTKEKMFDAVFSDIVSSIIPEVFEIIVKREQSISTRVEELVNAYYNLFKNNPHLPLFVVREMNRDSSLLIETAKRLGLQSKLSGAIASLQQEMNEGKLKNVPLRFLFYNLYGLLIIPFLSQDFSSTIFLDDEESFDDLLNKWKPNIISQMSHLLEK